MGMGRLIWGSSGLRSSDSVRHCCLCVCEFYQKAAGQLPANGVVTVQEYRSMICMSSMKMREMGWAMTIPREAKTLLLYILLCPSYACMTTSLSLVPKYCSVGKAHLSYSKPVEALLKQQQIHHRFLKSTTSNFSPGPSTTCPGLSASV